MDWIDRRLRVGEVELRVVTGCPRCVMVTREVGTVLPPDRTVLRHVVRELDQLLGVYAEVVTPGAVRTGDPVEVLG
jgi:uncharacterized protein YcbX